MILKEQFPLKPYNTFQIEASAKYWIEVNNIEELKEFYASDYVKVAPRLILGGGSNILFTKDFDGLVLHSRINTIEVLEENPKDVLIRSGSGVTWDDFVAHCVKNGWGGLENLSDIPGSVGASPVQNIGAYGVEAKDTIESVEVFDLYNGTVSTFKNELCEFGYRSSIFKKQEHKHLFVTRVNFRLQKSPVLHTSYGKIEEELLKLPIEKRNIESLREVIIKIRSSKLPQTQELGSAGSFFKNPVVDETLLNTIQKDYPDMPFYKVDGNRFKIPAAWLIQTCGLKGFKMGNAATYHAQPLVIVNLGQAEGSEVVALSEHIQATIKQKFGIVLEPEVCFI